MQPYALQTMAIPSWPIEGISTTLRTLIKEKNLNFKGTMVY
jgi:hypothetical protein